jgi:large-conductance mechanosensitive channel
MDNNFNKNSNANIPNTPNDNMPDTGVNNLNNIENYAESTVPLPGYGEISQNDVHMPENIVNFQDIPADFSETPAKVFPKKALIIAVTAFVLLCAIVLLIVNISDKKEDIPAKTASESVDKDKKTTTDTEKTTADKKKTTAKTENTEKTTNTRKNPSKNLSAVNYDSFKKFSETVISKITDKSADIKMSMTMGMNSIDFNYKISKDSDSGNFYAYQEANQYRMNIFDEKYTIITNDSMLLMLPEYSDVAVALHEDYADSDNDIWHYLYKGEFNEFFGDSFYGAGFISTDNMTIGSDGYATGTFTLRENDVEDENPSIIKFTFSKDGEKQIIQMDCTDDDITYATYKIVLTYGEKMSVPYKSIAKDPVEWFTEIDEKRLWKDIDKTDDLEDSSLRDGVIFSVFGGYDEFVKASNEKYKNVYRIQTLEESAEDSATKSVKFELEANQVLEKMSYLRDVMEINYFVNETATMVGHPFEFSTECDVKSGTVTFTMDMKMITANNFKNLDIYYYPIDVTQNQVTPERQKTSRTSSGILTADYNGNGFYLVLNTVEWNKIWNDSNALIYSAIIAERDN